ncbi:MAG: hypothetical protein IKH31_02070 [Clostridia bacterium]|nr:hypothetical protein [Clostridia bacterium]
MGTVLTGQLKEDEIGIYGFLRKGYYELLIRLDEDGWTGENILDGIAPADEGWEKWTLSENFVSLYAPENAYLCGRGADGSYFLAVNNPVSLGKVEVVGEASWYVFLRYAADGELISAVSPDIAHEKWSDESEEYFIFAADGCFYYMYVFEDRTEFYRITL